MSKYDQLFVDGNVSGFIAHQSNTQAIIQLLFNTFSHNIGKYVKPLVNYSIGRVLLVFTSIKVFQNISTKINANIFQGLKFSKVSYL